MSREYSASSLRYLRPFSISSFTRATAHGGTYLQTCLPRPPFVWNLNWGLARLTVPSLSAYCFRLLAMEPSANSVMDEISAAISRMRFSLFSLGWDSAVRAKGRGSAASEETERQLPRTGAAGGCEVSRVGRSTVYNRTHWQMRYLCRVKVLRQNVLYYV